MNFAHELLQWFDVNKRALPWRERIDVYHTWLSEVMSQQTTMAVVVPRFLQFITELPNIEALAGCDEATLRRMWAGLGYYARARNLKKAAEYIVNNLQGKFPTRYDEWLNISGCGPYTASVIASICFREPVACVDGNVVRVLSRFKGLEDVWSRKGQQQIQQWASELLEPSRPGDFNQAMMELGALVCRKQNPDCGTCPLQQNCVAKQKNLTSVLPPIKPKADACDVRLSALVLRAGERQKQYYVGDRSSGRFLTNTHGFAVIDEGLSHELKQTMQAISSISVRIVPTAFKHTITHHKIKTDVFVLDCNDLEPQDCLKKLKRFFNFSKSLWIDEKQLESSLSTAFDKKTLRSFVRQKKPTV